MTAKAKHTKQDSEQIEQNVEQMEQIKCQPKYKQQDAEQMEHKD